MDNTPTGNKPVFFGQKVSIPGVNINSAGDNQLILKDDYNSRIYYDTSGVPHVLLGLRSKNAFNGISINQQGLFVSEDGVDVTKATDGQLIFNSGQDMFKIVKKIPTSIPSFTTTYNGSSTSGGVLLTVPHGQTFTPIPQIYVQAQLLNFQTFSLIASAYIPLPVYVSAGNSTNVYFFPSKSGTLYLLSILFGVDDTNVYIQAGFGSDGNEADTISAIPATIFILQETAEH